jgi:hypothetical protein
MSSIRPSISSFGLFRARRSGLVLIAAAALAAAIVVPTASQADNASGCDFAANGTTPSCSAPLSPSKFEAGDGNLVPNTTGNTDWSNVANLNAGIDQPSGTSDNSFGQGTKEDNAAVTVVSGSIPPNKSDLTRFYEASENISNNNFLYLAWERTNVLGSANMDFEINQAVTPNFTGTFTGPIVIQRTAGDLLVTFDFTNGGGTPTLSLLKWVTAGSTSQCFASNSLPCWGNHVTLNGSDSIGAVNNLDTVNDPIVIPPAPGNRPLSALTFGEAAINLTTAGVFPSGTCEAFGSVFLKSRASASFTAEVKDFVAPVPVNISNCGSIKIIKHTDPRGQSQAFGYTSNLPAEAAGTVGSVPQGGVKCAGNSSAGVQSDGSFCLNDTGNSAGGDSAGNTVYNASLQSGSYNVTEGADPPGFTFESLSCTGGTTNTSGKTATISLAAGDAVVCTYVNQQNSAGLATQVSNAGPVFPSTAVHDTATVTGNQAADSPSGPVTFYLCGPIATGACDGTTNVGTLVGTGSLSTNPGAVETATSPDVNTSSNALTPGRYCFEATWPGDTNYPGALAEFGGSSGTNECFTVQTIATGTVTTPSAGSGGTTTFGSSVTDHAVITATASGGGTPTGSVAFFVCNPTQTTGGACPTGGTAVGIGSVTTQAVLLSSPPASSADSVGVTVNMTGTWCFRAVYTPGGTNGANYTGSSDASSGECFTVTDTTSGSSAQTWLPNDTATITSAHGAPLNGTMSIQLYTGGLTCATGADPGTAVSGQLYTKTLTNATLLADRTLTTGNTTFRVLANAAVSWLVSFSSTDANVASSSHCESSSLTINN